MGNQNLKQSKRNDDITTHRKDANIFYSKNSKYLKPDCAIIFELGIMVLECILGLPFLSRMLYTNDSKFNLMNVDARRAQPSKKCI